MPLDIHMCVHMYIHKYMLPYVCAYFIYNSSLALVSILIFVPVSIVRGRKKEKEVIFLVTCKVVIFLAKYHVSF